MKVKVITSLDHKGFQSSFELTGYINDAVKKFQADNEEFQSFFELTGYITSRDCHRWSFWR